MWHSSARGITGDTIELGAVNRVNQAIKVMYDKLGMDYAVGLKLPTLLQRRGVNGLIVENDVPLSAGGSGMATIMKMSAVQLREKYLATGVVTEQDLDRYCRFVDDPQTWGHLLRDGRGERSQILIDRRVCARRLSRTISWS